MDILLTYDYELFFGEQVGTVEACMLEPTRRIVEVLSRHGARATFYVDAGYLVRCEELGEDGRGRAMVIAQLQRLQELGHGIELHVHPHWEDTHFQDGRWIVDASRYRLADFAVDDARDIIRRYASSLRASVGESSVAYRAGGWCLQPFEGIGDALFNEGIRVESTVVPGARSMSTTRSFDFRQAPDRPWWRFDGDPLAPIDEGRFIELPIASVRVSPSYFWRVALSRLSASSAHRALGDGISLPGDKARLLRSLVLPSVVPLTLDGAKARALSRVRERVPHEGPLVAIGHPKAQTPASLHSLEAFLQAHPKDRFISTRAWLAESDPGRVSDCPGEV